MKRAKSLFPEELSTTQEFLKHARHCYDLKLFRASILYCALAIESFWWRIRFGKPDIMVSYVRSETGMKWLTKAQEEGLLTSEDRSIVDAIFTIRHAHMHFNPHMKTVARYNHALKKFGLDSAELAKEGRHIASEPIAKTVLLQTEELLQRWLALLG